MKDHDEEELPGGAAALRTVLIGLAFGAGMAGAWTVLTLAGIWGLGLGVTQAATGSVWLLAASWWIACRAGDP